MLKSLVKTVSYDNFQRTPADLSGLAELARDWKKRRRGVLVYLLTLACILHLNHAPGRTPVDVLSLTAMDNVWTQFREGFVEDQWLYQHEDIVYEIFSQLREKDCPFAPGWQASTTLVDGRIINPDGVILVETPWGRQWSYLEVELSDRTLRAVRPRCQKYGSQNRRDNFPLFVVCRDEQAERSFHLEAASHRLATWVADHDPDQVECRRIFRPTGSGPTSAGQR